MEDRPRHHGAGGLQLADTNVSRLLAELAMYRRLVDDTRWRQAVQAHAPSRSKLGAVGSTPGVRQASWISAAWTEAAIGRAAPGSWRVPTRGKAGWGRCIGAVCWRDPARADGGDGPPSSGHDAGAQWW
jgi:hypothetical protein